MSNRAAGIEGNKKNNRSNQIDAKPVKIHSPGNPISFQHLLKERTESLKALLKAIIPLSDSPLNRVLPPLREVLLLMTSFVSDPADGDLMLMEKFIESWLLKYGDELPGQGKKELSELLALLKGERLVASREECLVYSLGNCDQEKGNIWHLCIEEGANTSPEDQVSMSCTFQMETENLGNITVKISGEGKTSECLFTSDSPRTRSVLKRAAAGFREQLARHGCLIPRIKIGNRLSSSPRKNSPVRRGVDLWG